MEVKQCPSCGGKSYSANKKNWTCPYCGENLDEVDIQKVK